MPGNGAQSYSAYSINGRFVTNYGNLSGRTTSLNPATNWMLASVRGHPIKPVDKTGAEYSRGNVAIRRKTDFFRPSQQPNSSGRRHQRPTDCCSSWSCRPKRHFVVVLEKMYALCVLRDHGMQPAWGKTKRVFRKHYNLVALKSRPHWRQSRSQLLSLSTFCPHHGAGDKKSTLTSTPVWTSHNGDPKRWTQAPWSGKIAWGKLTPLGFADSCQ